MVSAVHAQRWSMQAKTGHAHTETKTRAFSSNMAPLVGIGYRAALGVHEYTPQSEFATHWACSWDNQVAAPADLLHTFTHTVRSKCVELHAGAKPNTPLILPNLGQSNTDCNKAQRHAGTSPPLCAGPRSSSKNSSGLPTVGKLATPFVCWGA